MAGRIALLGLDDINFDGATVTAPNGFKDSWDSHLTMGGPEQLSGTLRVRLDGYKIRFDFTELRIDTSHSVAIPFPVEQQPVNSRVHVIMGSHSDGEKGRYSVGPAVWRAGTLGERDLAGPGAALLLRSVGQELITAGSPQDSLLPLGLTIRPGGHIELNLKTRSMRIPRAMLQGELRSLDGAAGAPLAGAMYENADMVEVLFKDMANAESGRAKPWKIPLRHTGARPAPLNVSRDGARTPGLEAVGGGLSVTLVDHPAKRGAVVQAAALTSSADGPLALRFRGLRNSLNEAEVWTSDQPVTLAFRSREQGRPCSPLVDSAANRPIGGWRRRRQYLDPAAARLKPLPMHCLITEAQLRPDAGAVASLVTHVGRTAIVGPPVAWCDKGMQLRQTRPWFELRDARFLHARPGESFQGDKPEELAWAFTPGDAGPGKVTGAAPLVPPACWTADGEAADQAKADGEIDKVFKSLSAKPLSAPVLHETGLADNTIAETRIDAIMPRPGDAGAALKLAKQGRVVLSV